MLYLIRILNSDKITLPTTVRKLRCVVLTALLVVPGYVAARNADPVDLYTAGDYEQTVNVLEQAIVTNPEDPDLFFLLGLSYQKLGRHTDTIGALRRCLTLRPDYQAAHLPLGIAYFEAKLPRSAEPELRRALAVNSENGSAWMFLGLVQQDLQQHREAILSFERAAEFEPDLRQNAMRNRDISREIVQRRTTGTKGFPDAAASASSEGGAAKSSPPLETADVRPWRLSFQSGIEYDDNVTTSEADITTGDDDVAALFELSAAYTPFKSGGSEIELGYDFYQSLYSDLSDFDLRLHTAYALASRETVLGDLGIEYRYTDANLGGDSFFGFHSVKSSTGFSGFEGFYHTLSYNYQNKNFKTDNARDAHQHGVNIDSYYLIREGAFGYATFRYENENTNGDQFDYEGYYANLGVSGTFHPIAALPTRVSAGYRYFLRDYSKTTPSIGKEREDQRHIVTFRVEQPLSQRLTALLDYQYIGADSNLPSTDFTENIISLSLRFAL